MPRLLTRRHFLALAALASPALLVAEARWWEPHWLKIRRLRLATGTPAHRFVHFTDFHYVGEKAYAQRIIDTINRLAPDFACFTGDLIESTELMMDEALGFIRQIRCPVYGIPGNHDYWSHMPFPPFREAFAATGGAWLMGERLLVCDGRLEIAGLVNQETPSLPPRTTAPRRILLTHYPAVVDELSKGETFDVILAGHSHGGQVRIPFYGALILPYGVGRYDLGLFRTPAGPLYVNPGVGYFLLPWRFNCRPEITVVEI